MHKTPTRKVSKLLPTALIAQAITRGLETDEPLEAGNYTVHGTAMVEIDCTVTKAEDGDRKASYTPDLASVLAYSFWTAGVAGENVAAIAEAAIAGAHEGGAPEMYLDLAKAGVKRATEKIAEQLPRPKRSGATNVRGSVSLVAFDPS